MISQPVVQAIGVFLAKGVPLLVLVCLLYSLLRSGKSRR